MLDFCLRCVPTCFRVNFRSFWSSFSKVMDIILRSFRGLDGCWAASSSQTRLGRPWDCFSLTFGQLLGRLGVLLEASLVRLGGLLGTLPTSRGTCGPRVPTGCGACPRPPKTAPGPLQNLLQPLRSFLLPYINPD